MKKTLVSRAALQVLTRKSQSKLRIPETLEADQKEVVIMEVADSIDEEIPLPHHHEDCLLNSFCDNSLQSTMDELSVTDIFPPKRNTEDEEEIQSVSEMHVPDVGIQCIHCNDGSICISEAPQGSFIEIYQHDEAPVSKEIEEPQEIPVRIRRNYKRRMCKTCSN